MLRQSPFKERKAFMLNIGKGTPGNKGTRTAKTEKNLSGRKEEISRTRIERDFLSKNELQDRNETIFGAQLESGI